MSNSRRRHLAACTAVLAVLSVQHLAGQGRPILPSTRVVQAGPAALYPAISLRNAGTDSNVYYEETDPREDFTYSVTPRLYAVVPMGSGEFMGTATGDFVYYRTYKDQQSVNAFVEGRYDVVDSLVRPFAAAAFATRRERQGFEIDARARQTQETITLGTDVELTAITSLTAWVRHENTSWDRDEQYRGVFLAEELDRSEDILAAGARFRVTPFTRIGAAAENQRDRFEHTPERDADSLRIAPTVEFDGGGRFAGQARAGYRAFRPLYPGVARYSGFTGSAAMSYVFLDLTRVAFDAGHDVKYSFEPLQPCYLESGVRFKVTQRIVGPLEAVAIGERWRLRYQQPGGASFDGRQDSITTLGGGVGLRFGREMELTLTVDRTERSSSAAGRNYERRRVLASVSYGL